MADCYKTYRNPLNFKPELYRGKVILAPMVRVCRLPVRILALRYGADIVYSEELIDYKLATCRRVENTATGSIDFIEPDGTTCLTISPSEKDQLVVQIGTADPERALEAAKLVQNDVMGIDVNMGCPKSFSMSGGMGAALLKKPALVSSILRTLTTHLSVPVTCKIRLLQTVEETLDLIKVIRAAGVSALAIHGRLVSERPRHPLHGDMLAEICSTLKANEEDAWPVIVNGGSATLINSYSDIERFRHSCGSSSVMVARAAMWNPSIFQQSGLEPGLKIAQEFLKLCIDFDLSVFHAKYVLQNFRGLPAEIFGKFQSTNLFREIAAIFDVEDYFINSLKRKTSLSNDSSIPVPYKIAKSSSEADHVSFELEISYSKYKKAFQSGHVPKVLLRGLCSQRFSNSVEPSFLTEPESGHRWKTTVTLGSKTFRSAHSERNKKYSEQCAALVTLLSLGVRDWRLNPVYRNEAGLAHLEVPEEEGFGKKVELCVHDGIIDLINT